VFLSKTAEFCHIAHTDADETKSQGTLARFAQNTTQQTIVARQLAVNKCFIVTLRINFEFKYHI